MRPLLVKGGDELIEPGLLLQEFLGGRLGGLLLERQVHALVPPVLLGVTWLDALDADAQPQPPDRQLGEAEQGVGTDKGRPVIGANRRGQPEVLEGTLKDGEGDMAWVLESPSQLIR